MGDKISRTTLRAWIERSLLVGLLLAAYIWVWRPARAWIGTNVLVPAVQSVETERARSFDVAPQPLGVSVSSETMGTGMRAPGGILFLLPALLLVAAFPRRPYWLYLWGYHLGLGALLLGTLCLGVAWADGAFTVHQFLKGPVRTGTSLAAPILAVWVSRSSLLVRREG